MEDIGEHGRTVLFVSHNMPAVTRLCPRTILIKDGLVFKDGPSHKVVSAYMDSEKGTKAENIWPDLMSAPGDEVVRLRSIKVRAKDGSVSEAMDIREPVGIEMEYEVLQSGHALFAYIHVVNEEGIELFESFENDAQWRGRARPAGRYVSTTWIPGNFLAEGLLYITPAIRTLNPETRRLKVSEAVAFHVVDSLDGDSARIDTADRMSGVIRPLLQWETNFDQRTAENTAGK
jgi:lipopolysaccharide transport system ATP-binding protein